MNKVFQVVEAITPVANEIYDKESLDVIEIGNPSNRVIAAPGEFTLGETLTTDDFHYENRVYQDRDGSNEVAGVFAVRSKGRKSFTDILFDARKLSSSYIKDALSQQPEFVFESEPFDEDGVLKESVYDDLPRGDGVGKYSYYQEFAITSVYIDESGQPMYRGIGVGDSYGEKFNNPIFELGEWPVAQIAETIYKILNSKKI